MLFKSKKQKAIRKLEKRIEKMNEEELKEVINVLKYQQRKEEEVKLAKRIYNVPVDNWCFIMQEVQ